MANHGTWAMRIVVKKLVWRATARGCFELRPVATCILKACALARLVLESGNDQHDHDHDDQSRRQHGTKKVLGRLAITDTMSCVDT